MTTRQPITSPSHETLLADLFELNFRIEDLIAKHSLTPAQFLAFAKDPVVVETLDAFESLQQRHQRIAARQHQAGAAGHLHQSILDAPSTIETRRAATALARLTTQMQSPRTPRPPRAGACRPAEEPDRDTTQVPATTIPPASTNRTANPVARSSPAATATIEPKPPRGNHRLASSA
jgi:hypothetical protein